jgi:NTP pyrophosphatase (non-canonical NTP hydrolase)
MLGTRTFQEVGELLEAIRDMTSFIRSSELDAELRMWAGPRPKK